MKKFWIVLLSLGLIMAFTMPVLAADVKFSGEYKVQGIYEDNVRLVQGAGQSNQGVSLTWQRLRMGTDFKVAEGLSLTTRFDALERVWGNPRTNTAGLADTVGVSNAGALNNAEQQNIRFDQAYITFNAAFGVFRVGYQKQGCFGTAFADNGERDNGPRARYDFATGPLSFAVIWEKMDTGRNNLTYVNNTVNDMDKDVEKYHVFGVYKWSTGDTGLLLSYVSNTTTIAPNRQQLFAATPYVKATFGPVYVEAEGAYQWGKQRAGVAGTADIDKSGYNLYIHAKVDLAPAYVGVGAFYVSGDDGADTSKSKAGPGTGTDFNPLLILLNYDLARWGGGTTGYGLNTVVGTSAGAGMANLTGYLLYAGIKPMPKLDVKFSWGYAAVNDLTAAQAGWSKDIGHEFDLTATYNIYDNLSYMVGAAYLLTGDFVKAGVAGAQTKNDYLLTHMLTLKF